MEISSSTLKFQNALPFAVLPVSTQLAALHVIRTHSHSSNSCKRCGSEHTTHTRVVRSKRDPHPSRAITSTCNACGAVHSIPLIDGNASAFPRTKRKATLSEQSIHASDLQPRVHAPVIDLLPSSPKPRSAAVIVPSKIIPSDSRSQSNPKSKNKSGLQQLLHQNREKERKRTKLSEAEPAGLSAFLSTL
ncbi:hypothetical protein B0H34DRAFT_231992 [Crassisporium funariophilum]|nr:hypothetical protein B0H34DRAFT_231992 [Crassisporium funariophilum]